jgi:hypothetical protein
MQNKGVNYVHFEEKSMENFKMVLICFTDNKPKLNAPSQNTFSYHIHRW